jgi:tight adherence protein C
MPLFVLRIVPLVLISAATLWSVHYVSALPSQAAGRLGLRGVARARALSRYAWFRAVEPFVRWGSVRIQPLLPVTHRASLDTLLTRAGDPLGVEPAELWVLCAMLGFTGGTCGVLYAAIRDRSALYSLILALVLAFFPITRVQSLVDERTKRVRQGLPAVVDLLCLSLSAGLDFPSAVRQIVDKSSQKGDPLTYELGIVLSELSLGKTRREALENFARRNASPSVQEFVGSVVQAEEEGTPLAQMLQIQAKVSRQRRSVRAEEAASNASLQLLVPMGLVFVAVLILIGGPLVLTLIKEFGRAN